MRRTVSFIFAVVLLVLALSSVALAATPQDIYNDYAADHKLDGTYTDAELQAYLDDAWLDQYGEHTVLTALDGIVAGIISGSDRDTFPFTGAQVALMAFGALALIGGGVGLRRLTRSRA